MPTHPPDLRTERPERLRVLHVINGLNVGGAETMLHKLLATTDRTVFDPVVVSLTGNGPLTGRIRELGIPVHSIGLAVGTGLPTAVWRLWEVLRSAAVDVIQGWQYHGNVVARLAQRLLPQPVPMLWNIRHSIPDARNEPRRLMAVVRLGARWADRAACIIYAAHASARQHEALGYPSVARVVVPNGFDTDRFAPCAPARLRLRQALGLEPSTVLIGKVARYHPMKDHATFLRAAGLLLQSHPTVHFVLAGQGIDRHNAELVRQIGGTPLAGRVHLLGPREDAHEVIAALDLLTSAAAYGEAFPNVLGEAMACGVPCVATDVGDSALIVGDLGQVVPPRDPGALSRAWRSLIEMGDHERIQLGLRARRHVVDTYGLRAIVARYETLYGDVARARPWRVA